MSRILKIATVAVLLSGLAGCAVVPAPVAYVGPNVAVGVAVRPAPYVVAPGPYYGPPRYDYGYRGHGHGYGYRGW